MARLHTSTKEMQNCNGMQLYSNSDRNFQSSKNKAYNPHKNTNSRIIHKTHSYSDKIAIQIITNKMVLVDNTDV